MELSDKTIRDIGLDKLTNLVSEFNTDYRSFLQRLAKIPADIENVSYRQDIFHELMTNKKLADETMQFVDDAAKLEKRMIRLSIRYVLFRVITPFIISSFTVATKESTRLITDSFRFK